MNMKEIAKILSGLTAWEAIVHLSLAFSGLLPIKWFGLFTLTPTVNTIQIFVPAIISILLIYYAWGKKSEEVRMLKNICNAVVYCMLALLIAGCAMFRYSIIPQEKNGPHGGALAFIDQRVPDYVEFVAIPGEKD